MDACGSPQRSGFVEPVRGLLLGGLGLLHAGRVPRRHWVALRVLLQLLLDDQVHAVLVHVARQRLALIRLALQAIRLVGFVCWFLLLLLLLLVVVVVVLWVGGGEAEHSEDDANDEERDGENDCENEDEVADHDDDDDVDGCIRTSAAAAAAAAAEQQQQQQQQQHSPLGARAHGAA